MIDVYVYSGCDTCRRAKNWLLANKVSYRELPIREQPPTEDQLDAALTWHGGNVKKLFNVSGRDYRAQGLKERLPTMPASEALERLSQNGNLVKRPFLVTPKGARAGFDEAEWRSLLDLPASD